MFKFFLYLAINQSKFYVTQKQAVKMTLTETSFDYACYQS
jgi:hypothetical protein